LISRHVTGLGDNKPFRYFDKGNMAVVGKGFAVLQTGGFRMHGMIAWFAWAFIHITFLAQLSLKISVFLQWAWLFVTGQRGSRLIVNQPSGTTQASPEDR
jgi:NADH dehydrogenase